MAFTSASTPIASINAPVPWGWLVATLLALNLPLLLLLGLCLYLWPLPAAAPVAALMAWLNYRTYRQARATLPHTSERPAHAAVLGWLAVSCAMVLLAAALVLPLVLE